MGQTVMVTESQEARQDSQLLFIISSDDMREGFNIGGGQGDAGVEKFQYLSLQHPPNPPVKKCENIHIFKIETFPEMN